LRMCAGDKKKIQNQERNELALGNQWKGKGVGESKVKKVGKP